MNLSLLRSLNVLLEMSREGERCCRFFGDIFVGQGEVDCCVSADELRT